MTSAKCPKFIEPEAENNCTWTAIELPTLNMEQKQLFDDIRQNCRITVDTKHNDAEEKSQYDKT